MTVAQHVSDLKVCSLYSELSDWIERCRSQIDSSPEGQIASFMRDWLVVTHSGHLQDGTVVTIHGVDYRLNVVGARREAA